MVGIVFWVLSFLLVVVAVEAVLLILGMLFLEVQEVDTVTNQGPLLSEHHCRVSVGVKVTTGEPETGTGAVAVGRHRLGLTVRTPVVRVTAVTVLLPQSLVLLSLALVGAVGLPQIPQAQAEPEGVALGQGFQGQPTPAEAEAETPEEMLETVGPVSLFSLSPQALALHFPVV